MRRFLRIVKSNINPVILFSGVLKYYNLLAPISLENCSKTTQFVAIPLITNIIISVIYQISILRNQIELISYFLLSIISGGRLSPIKAASLKLISQLGFQSPSRFPEQQPHPSVSVSISAANRLIGEVVQSQRRPLLGPHPG